MAQILCATVLIKSYSFTKKPFVDIRMKLKYIIPVKRFHDDRHNFSAWPEWIIPRIFPHARIHHRQRGLFRRGFYTISSVFVLYRTWSADAFICSGCRVTRSHAKSATYLYSFVYSAHTVTFILVYAGRSLSLASDASYSSPG